MKTVQVFSRGRRGSDPLGTHRSRKTWVLLGEGQSREEVKILRGQWIPEGKIQSLGLLLSGGADLKALGLKKIIIKALGFQVPPLPGTCALEEILWRVTF